MNAKKLLELQQERGAHSPVTLADLFVLHQDEVKTHADAAAKERLEAEKANRVNQIAQLQAQLAALQAAEAPAVASDALAGIVN